jgi:phage protein U
VGRRERRGTLLPRPALPYRIGGLENIEAVEAMRRGGMAEMLVRGDGRVLGWYVIERMVRQHTFLAPDGVGQVIHFEAIFVRVLVPAADEEFAKIWRRGFECEWMDSNS